MALKQFMGFDLFGSGNNGTNPTNGAGITGTPLGWSAVVSGANVGVSGLAGDKLGSGGDLRNGLVAVKAASGSISAYIQSDYQINIKTNASFRHIIGFTFKEIGSQQPAANVSVCRLANYHILQLNTSGVFVLANGATGVVREFNREYYIELVLECIDPNPAAPNNVVNAKLYIDGTLAFTRSFGSYSPTVDTIQSYQLGIDSGSSDTRARRYVYGDVYIADMSGGAPYNDVLGPQKVLPVYADEVVSNDGWVPSSGSDPLAMISEADGRNDATFLTSPTADEALTLKCDFKTTSRSVVNGLRFFARSKRDAGAARSINTKLADAQGNQIGTSPTVALATAFADQEVLNAYPTDAASALSLKHATLDAATLTLRASA